MPIIADLGRDLAKSLGDQSPNAEELELAMQFDQCNAALRATTEKYANLYSRMVGALSPQARAAADVMGIKLKKEIGVLEDCSIEIQKRLIGVRRSRSQALAKRGFDDARADLATLRSHMHEVNSGTVRLDERTRKRLVSALGIAEERVRLSA